MYLVFHSVYKLFLILNIPINDLPKCRNGFIRVNQIVLITTLNTKKVKPKWCLSTLDLVKKTTRKSRRQQSMHAQVGAKKWFDFVSILHISSFTYS